MIKIKIEDTEYRCPERYSEITLVEYEKWYDKDGDSPNDKVELIAAICNMPKELLLQMPASLFYRLNEAVVKIFEKNINDFKASNKIDIDGITYVINNADEISLGEYVDSQSVNDLGEKKLSTLLAIICRPVNEKYNSDNNGERIKMFGELTLDKAFPLFAFFLQLEKSYSILMSTFSQSKEMASQFLADTENFLKNGDGRKSFMSWRKRIFLKLMKLRMKKLLKSLTI